MLKTPLQKYELKQLIYIYFKKHSVERFTNDLLKNMVRCYRSYSEFDKKNLFWYEQKKKLPSRKPKTLYKTLRNEFYEKIKT